MVNHNDNSRFLHFLNSLGANTARRFLVLLLLDCATITTAYLGAFLLHYPVVEWDRWLHDALLFLPVFLTVGVLFFYVFGLYRTLWRYASVDSMLYIAGGTFFGVLVPNIFVRSFGVLVPHWSVLVIQWMLLFLLVSSGRFIMRVVRSFLTVPKGNDRTRILIYGAGDAGEMLCRDLLNNKNNRYTCIGFIDDDLTKHHKAIHNVPVLGSIDSAEDLVSKNDIDEIIVALPSLSGAEIRTLLDKLKKTVDPRVKLKTVPGLSEMIDGPVTFNQVRQFRVRDLLRRKPIELNAAPVDKLIRGKTVLISGAGGSIGAEICRQVCTFSPQTLILIDISEASLYLIEEELKGRFGDTPLMPIVGDICNPQRMENIFANYQPDIVFHAAAYKHVPLMEANPWAAVHNNIVGTRVLAEISANYNVDRFVMISTDKAVRPTSIMGATKRLCEMVMMVQEHAETSVFTVVRFGNVMGSSGSVILKFDQQIKAGGPITVTDRNATRYFMLTSEAVQLVMQSATLSRDDAIYLLDMGEPVKIVDLATDMVRLSGLEPNIDIKIKFIGLRPGEKIHEELYHSGKGEPTPIDKISLTIEPVSDPEHFWQKVDALTGNCFSMSRSELITAISEIVPDYHCELRRREDQKIYGRLEGKSFGRVG